jgi:hypothetical protein
MKVVLMLWMMLFANSLFADVVCTDRVSEIYVHKDGSLHYFRDFVGDRLLARANDPRLPLFSTLLLEVYKNKYGFMYVTYPDGYDCNKANFDTAALGLRISKNGDLSNKPNYKKMTAKGK